MEKCCSYYCFKISYGIMMWSNLDDVTDRGLLDGFVEALIYG